MPPTLLATKLFVPPPRPALVARPRLSERLSIGLACKLTLVVAPAGFGKTTAVSAWLSSAAEGGAAYPFVRRPARAAWVSLDDDDNDPARFWSYMAAALDTLAPGVGEAALALLHAPQPAPITAALTTLINGLSALGDDAVLVLDDYHLITTPAIHEALAFLLDHGPPRLHFVLTSRAEPPLPLARLRARGQLVELRAPDLRFSPDEAAAFLADVMRLPLDPADMAALEERTEGWIAGLQLAALAMGNRTDTARFLSTLASPGHFVFDYLAEEVFARQPRYIQTFLLQTALLDRLCGSLCDAVLGLAADGEPPTADRGPSLHGSADAVVGGRRSAVAAYSHLVLQQLDHANLFLVPLDDERGWYRYHHLFGAFLRERLLSGASPIELAQLHRRASDWFERTGAISEAVQHALAAHDEERAALLVEQHASAFFVRGEAMVVQRWVGQLPEELLRRRPILALRASWMHVFTGQFDAAEQTLRNALAFDQQAFAPADRGSALVLRSTIARRRGDVANTFTLARQALDIIPEDNAMLRAAAQLNIGIALLLQGFLDQAVPALEETVRLGLTGGNLYGALAAVDELAQLRLRQGKLAACLELSQHALATAATHAERLTPAAGLPQTNIGIVRYAWNELELAVTTFAQAIERLQRSTELGALLRAFLGLARSQAAQGRHELMRDTVARCEAWFARLELPDDGYLAAHLAAFWARQGELAPAEHWAQRVVPPIDDGANYLSGVQRRALALLHLRRAQQGRQRGADALRAVEALLAPLIAFAVEHGCAGDLIELQIVWALAHQAAGWQQKALDIVKAALRGAQPAGYVRSFLDEGLPMRSLLLALRSSLTNDERLSSYIDGLLAAFPPTEAAPTSIQHSKSPIQNLIEPLTERELEVLRLIAQGHSNQQIADALIVSVGTVKKHLNNIFGKLDAQSRTQAVARAREAGLL